MCSTENICDIEAGHTTDSLSTNVVNSTTDSSSKCTDNSVTDISSENENNSMSTNSAITSAKNRKNTTVQTIPKKALKVSLSRKQHSYQICDPLVNANCSN